MESKIVPNTSREDRRPEKLVSKFHKCERTSSLPNTCSKKTKINQVQVISEVHCAEEKEDSDQASAVSDDTPAEDYPVEVITAFF
ncbi:hypothetical protein O181_049120 [Austropuccinia psidii MF-1]|uniref:Uncharacterized protein n=1 Tax=Austropuccinia psidii MF-1 TaxID=1389203 RepID=A0A9Q3DYJ0_9BASI|nr:hypothetical protein [Austropuccinia psidii MF-1]